jgi:hypothetical protein
VANPTSIVPATRQFFENTRRYWPITGANNPYSYMTNQMMGLVLEGAHAGYCDNMDDSQPLAFLGLWTGIQALVSSSTDGGGRALLDRPQFISMPLVAGQNASRAADFGKPLYAADAGHVTLLPAALVNANLVGHLVDVDGSGLPDALTAGSGGNVWFEPVGAKADGDYIITPAALAADVNNYAPAGISRAKNLLLSQATGATINITGLVAGYPWQETRLINTSLLAADTFTLKNASASSLAANRFIGTNAADVVLQAGGAITLLYDPIATSWRILAL